MARALLGQNVMVTATMLSSTDRVQVLRFAASFLWADLEVADAERRFLTELARELDVNDASSEVAGLLAQPPVPEDVDPTSVAPAIADLVRQARARRRSATESAIARASTRAPPASSTVRPWPPVSGRPGTTCCTFSMVTSTPVVAPVRTATGV